ncbi:MAG: deoxynucleoside kinase [Ruminococcus bromii]|jgi:dTMP kinase|nr:deoxynucleoside kinase [Ruminococcus bromii]MEE3498610.1 deoxynucleoside kinase [Ruminococcus bromii]HCB94955.1 thymidylate kinase [Ruminococcus sp.]
MKSKLIVIEGLDGSGKATQTKLLADKLTSMGRTVRKLEFPDYDSPSSSLVKMYLNGDFGKNPEDVNAYAASAFYAVDRAASYLKNWKNDCNNGSVILCDRYCTSNIIYQMSKVKNDERDGFIEWQSDFEYNKLGLPVPDAVIYLDVDPDVSQRLMEKRYGGDKSKMDLHEKNVKFLRECRESAVYATQKCGWIKIDCCENGDIKSIEQIAAEIEKVVFDILKP